MNNFIKFNPKKLEKLNNPARFQYLNPDLIWTSFGVIDPAVIVDIGAGTGLFAKKFASKMQLGKIYACDFSAVMVDWMKQNLVNQEGTAQVIPVKSDESQLHLDNDTADLVYMMNVYHELENPYELILDAKRVLKDSGKLVVIDWLPVETPEGPPFEIRCSEDSVKDVLLKTGFSKIYVSNVLPYHYLISAQK